MFKRLILMALMLTAVLCTGCGAKTGEVHGIIVDESGDILEEEITVVLEPSPSDQPEEGKITVWSFEYSISDEYRERKQELDITRGEFLFSEVIPGYYSITVAMKNSPVNWGPGFEVKPGETVEQTITVK